MTARWAGFVAGQRITKRQVRIDASDARHHGIGGHGPPSVLPEAGHGYPSPMINARSYGAQSMTAPLHDVLVKPPGAAFGRAFDDPAHGFLHACDLEIARAEHAAFVDILASLGPTVHVLDEETDDPDLVYTFDPLLVTDRGAIPLRPGKPNRADEPAVLERWTTAAGIPTLGQIEAPGTVEGVTPSGCGPTSSASGGRCARTRPAWRSSAILSAGTCGSSMSRTGRARPSSST